MQKPEVVLEILSNKPNDYIFKDLHRHLYNKDIYNHCLRNFKTKASDEKLDQVIDLTIAMIKSGEYKFNPETYILSDKIVLKIINTILHAIFKNMYSKESHLGIDMRSAHTTISALKYQFNSIKWWIKIDISKDILNKKLILKVLKERINDNKFISLLESYIDTIKLTSKDERYSEQYNFNDIDIELINLLLTIVDNKILEIQSSFNSGDKRKPNESYARITKKIYKLKQKPISDETNTKIETLRSERLQFNAYDEMDENFKRLRFVRYGTSILIGCIGSKLEAETIKDTITQFITSQYGNVINHIELKHAPTETIRFIGYDLVYSKHSDTLRKGILWLRIPHSKMTEFLISNGMMIKDGGEWIPTSVTKLINRDPFEIFLYFNTLLTSFHKYYQLADNSFNLNGVRNIVKMSLAKTLAHKFKTHKSIIFKRYSKLGKFGIETSSGFYEFHNKSFAKNNNPILNLDIDNKPDVVYLYHSRSTISQRINKTCCSICGSTNNVEVHHINKLKNVDGSDYIKSQAALNRKIIYLCKECHNKLHAGKL